MTKSLIPFSVSVGGRNVSSLIDAALLVVDWEGLGWAANSIPCDTPRLPLANGATCAVSPRLSGDG